MLYVYHYHTFAIRNFGIVTLYIVSTTDRSDEKYCKYRIHRCTAMACVAQVHPYLGLLCTSASLFWPALHEYIWETTDTSLIYSDGLCCTRAFKQWPVLHKRIPAMTCVAWMHPDGDKFVHVYWRPNEKWTNLR